MEQDRASFRKRCSKDDEGNGGRALPPRYRLGGQH